MITGGLVNTQLMFIIMFYQQERAGIMLCVREAEFIAGHPVLVKKISDNKRFYPVEAMVPHSCGLYIIRMARAFVL